MILIRVPQANLLYVGRKSDWYWRPWICVTMIFFFGSNPLAATVPVNKGPSLFSALPSQRENDALLCSCNTAGPTSRYNKKYKDLLDERAIISLTCFGR